MKNGFTLVEVLIATAIILASVISLIGVHSLYLRTALANADGVKAAYLAEEGVEVVRFWRDLSWNNKIEPIALSTIYGLALSGTTWATTTSRYVGSLERTISLSPVYRNASGDIVSSGGTLDPDTVMIVSQVSWLKGGATTTRSISTYITNLYDN